MAVNSWHRVGALGDLTPGNRLGRMISGQPILIICIEEGIFAYEDRCPHKGAPLSDGPLIKNNLVCRHHKWQFDVRTGAAVSPRGTYLKSYPVKIENGDVFVKVVESRA